MNEIKNHGKKWLYWFFLGVAIIVVYKALDNFGDVMGVIAKFFEIITPFLVGIFISYLLYMPCKKIEEVYAKSKLKFVAKKARGFSIFTVYFIIFLLLLILINFILPVVFESVVDLINNIQNYYEIAIDNYNSLPDDNVLKSDVVNDMIQNIQNLDIKQYFQLEKILAYVMSAINAVTSLFNVIVAVIVSVYILAERVQIINSIKKLAEAIFKEKTYKNLGRYFDNSNEIFFKFIASQFLDAIIVGILVTIAMSIMGIKFAPLLGFLIGLFNMIPYIGAIIAVGISALITLITGGLSQAIWMLIVVIILQQIDANIINPKIIGQSLKISPLLVIFAITVGGAYFGILGMFLAVPAIAVVRILVEDYIDYKLVTKKIEKRGKERGDKVC
ncbi:MAG: AI-2E family transporter [Clostridia bacterium]|nr:AI-2E family transporter [Clostridia bacterium]